MGSMSRLLFATLFLLSLGTNAFAHTVSVRASAANLRAGPGLDRQVLRVIPQSESVRVLERSGRWARVEVAGRTGWMHQSTLNLTPQSLSGTVGEITVSTSANFRSGPSTAHRVVGKLRNRDRVRILETSGSWHKVEAGGRTGWVHRSLINTNCEQEIPGDQTADLQEISDYIEGQTPAPLTVPGNAAFQCAFRRAMEFHRNNRERHRLRDDFITLIDYDAPSSSQRMVIVDLRTGEVRRHNVAAGSGGISNVAESKGSATGFIRFSEPYQGKHGSSLRMDGLESRNHNVRARAIVLHGADYVTEGRHAGRSWGCPAVDRRSVSQISRRVQNGGLLYSYRGGRVCSTP